MNTFLKGILLGFSIAAPVGPIALLCIRRTLAYGRLSGIVSGLGAACADALYGAVAGLGLTVISQFLLAHQTIFRLGGGLFLCYLGITTFLSQPPMVTATVVKRNLLSDFASTFVLTITNPMTIVAFMAIFSGLALAPTMGNYLPALWLIVGVFVGSAAWWVLLCGVTGFLRTSLSVTGTVWLNRASGLIILIFGIFILMKIILND